MAHDKSVSSSVLFNAAAGRRCRTHGKYAEAQLGLGPQWPVEVDTGALYSGRRTDSFRAARSEKTQRGCQSSFLHDTKSLTKVPPVKTVNLPRRWWGGAGGERKSPQITTLGYVSDRAAVSAHTRHLHADWRRLILTLVLHNSLDATSSRFTSEGFPLTDVSKCSPKPTQIRLSFSFLHHLIRLGSRRRFFFQFSLSAIRCPSGQEHCSPGGTRWG